MMMPIVSMNKMAMNESVAATCCYREVATPTAVYWEVLNGGWIGSGYVQTSGWKSDEFKDYITNSLAGAIGFDFTYDNWADATAAIDGMYWDNGEAAYMTPGGEKLTKATIGVSDFKYDGACKHVDGTCNFRYDEPDYKENQHFESKGAHSTADDWKVAHTAKQYNS